MEKIFYTYLLILNALGLIAMYVDKRRSIKKQWRISEKALILLAALGGSLGIYLGMYSFRHKTKHKKFTLGVPIIIIIQLIIFPLFANDYETFLKELYNWF